LVPNDIFGRIGGMNNNFWGWDHEDNEFQFLLERNNISIRRQSKDIGTSYHNTVLHMHDIKIRKRDNYRCNNQTIKSQDFRDPKMGLNFTRYQIHDVQELSVQGYGVTFLNVRLHCDLEKTPWCSCERKI
jgi:hypothetical protein